MAKKSKRFALQVAKVTKDKTYSIDEGCQVALSTASAKFDETVEVAIILGVDPKKAEQNVRGSSSLPNGLGKKVRVAVFAKGAKAEEALNAGADIVGAEDLVEKIKEGQIEFDSVVATPDMMLQVGKVGKILGPKGLMPSPKVGTVTFDVGATVAAIKAGRVEYRVDKAGIVHAPLGKSSFGKDKILENLNTIINAIVKAKPQTSKGIYLKSASISLTMGPGVSIDITPYR